MEKETVNATETQDEKYDVELGSFLRAAIEFESDGLPFVLAELWNSGPHNMPPWGKQGLLALVNIYNKILEAVKFKVDEARASKTK